MSVRGAKVNRARRNALKAAMLVSAFLATSAVLRQASAVPGNNGNGKGGCGKGQQTNGCGGNGGHCFAQGTLIRTREGYRPIRQWSYLIVGTASKEEAEALATRLHGFVEPGGDLVWDTAPRNPFAVFGGMGG